MNISDIDLQTQHLTTLRDHPGWRDIIVPKLRARIASLEVALVAFPAKITGEETEQHRHERQILQSIIDQPETLLRSFAENRRLLSRRPATTETDGAVEIS